MPAISVLGMLRETKGAPHVKGPTQGRRNKNLHIEMVLVSEYLVWVSLNQTLRQGLGCREVTQEANRGSEGNGLSGDGR